LFFGSVLPSLFPFFIAVELLNTTNVAFHISRLFSKIMSPVFNVPGEGAYVMLTGMLSGYPTSAKMVAQYKEERIITPIEAERLLSFTNNANPLFIIGAVGITMFKSASIGVLLLVSHYLASISVGVIFRFWKRKQENTTHKYETFRKIHTRNSSVPLPTVLANSINNAIHTSVTIGGYVVFFCVVISLLNQYHIIQNIAFVLSNIFNIPTDILTSFVGGLLEVTNGCSFISTVPTKTIYENIPFVSFLLGFSGLCIAFQILAVASKANISLKPYIIGKLLQGTFASIYTIAIINYLGLV
jgi:sporulation integral membrane protein YlbJ